MYIDLFYSRFDLANQGKIYEIYENVSSYVSDKTLSFGIRRIIMSFCDANGVEKVSVEAKQRGGRNGQQDLWLASFPEDPWTDDIREIKIVVDVVQMFGGKDSTHV